MKRFLIILLFIALFHFGIAGCTGGGSGGSDGTALQTETVDSTPGEEETPVHNLFSSDPGTMVSMSALTGTVDPVGTNITDDFDGDGLLNDNETTGNVWVADYPHIGTTITTPVTMQIEILYNNETSSKEISSEIMSEDTEDTFEKSADKIHRNEVNLRTVQYQDSTNKSSSSSSNSRRGSITGSITTSHSTSSGATTTKWKDQPFKNDVDANNWAQKEQARSKKAKQLRTEYRAVSDTVKKIKPNAGYVRAALYISNKTVNMPVKLSNILCSFMLENNEGLLLPVQSFRLRNDDYSMFELNLYGDTTFGPYVIELTGLNTQEIKDAIAEVSIPASSWWIMR